MASSLPAPVDASRADAPRADGSAPQPLQRLDELPAGARAIIVEVNVAADPGGRLEELGFLPGTPVELVRRAPLGDPAVYALRGTRFCVRRSEARAVRVRLLPDQASGADEAGETSS